MVITLDMERFNKQTMSDTIQTEWVHMNCVQYRWNDGLIACLYEKGVGSNTGHEPIWTWMKEMILRSSMLMSLIV